MGLTLSFKLRDNTKRFISANETLRVNERKSNPYHVIKRLMTFVLCLHLTFCVYASLVKIIFVTPVSLPQSFTWQFTALFQLTVYRSFTRQLATFYSLHLVIYRIVSSVQCNTVTFFLLSLKPNADIFPVVTETITAAMQ